AEKSPNLCGNPRSPLGTGKGKKNDSPMRIWMGMRIINGDEDGKYDLQNSPTHYNP
nr:hypothetical protein [Tanacetum cinerariifolium]